MEKENKVQQPDAAQGAEAQKEEGAVGSFGKFKSADALLNAYNSLEAEFTRRSQRLRELEGRLQDGNRMSSAAEGESRQQPQSLDEQVGAAVEKYLAARQAPYIMADGGSPASAPAQHIRSLEEAGRLAQELFRKNI